MMERSGAGTLLDREIVGEGYGAAGQRMGIGGKWRVQEREHKDH